MDAHLLARQDHAGRRALADILALAELVDRDRRLVTMGHRPDDVLRAERRIAAEEDPRIGRAVGDLVDCRHVPLVELDSDVALDPGKGVFLAHGDEHIVAGIVNIRFAGRDQLTATLRVEARLDLLEHHAGESPGLVGEGLWERGS